MTTPFRQIPSRLRVPGVYIEQTSKLESTGTRLNTVLHLGHANGGIATPNEIYKISSLSQARDLFGGNSMLAEMAERHLIINKGLTLYQAAVPVPSAGIKAVGTISIDSVPTKAGVLSVRIGDRLISIAITASQTTASIATALAAAINLDSACWVTAEYADNDVTLEAKFMGVLGNEIPVVVGYNFEEVPPINITVTRMSGGAGTPDLNNVISNLGENPYDYIATPFTDSASLQALDQAVAERWHAMAAFNIQSVVYGVVSGTYDAISAKGKSLNSEFITLVGVDGQPQTSWIWAASLMAAVSDPLTNDPAAPITTLELLGLKAPRKCWNWKLRNELLFSGISTFTSDKAGNVYVDKLITTYQYDAQGYPDASYLSIHVPELMRNIRRIQAAALASSFRGYKLTDYPEQHAGGQKIISTDGIKAFLVALYGRSLMDERAWCTDANHYAESLLVERDPENRQRINYHDEPVMIGQLEIIAGHSELQHG